MSDSDSTPPTLLGRLGSSVTVIARGVEHRAELAALELDEARTNTVSLLTLLVAGAVVALLTGFALNFFVAALWWDTPHRLLSIGLLAGVQAVAAIWLIARWRHQARSWRPRASTFEQLRKDGQCLHELIKNPLTRS